MKFIGSCNKFFACKLRYYFSRALAEFFMSVQPSTYRSSAESQLTHTVAGGLYLLPVMSQHCRPCAYLLSERKRCRILEVSPSRLYNAGIFTGKLLKSAF